MGFSIVVCSNDSSLKKSLRDFYTNREEKIYFEDNNLAVILKLITGKADALFLDMETGEKDYLQLIDILRRIYTKLPIVVFIENDSVEELILLKNYGVFYSALKPLQLNLLEDITESIKLINNKMSLIKGGVMRSLNIALVLSTNKKLRQNLSYIFNEMGISYIFESKELNGLLRILSFPLKAVFIDVNPYDKNGLDFIKLVKNISPQLKIIAVSGYSSENDIIIDAGADYCIEKSVLETSSESIVDKFNALMKKEKHLEKNKIN
ncbi:MAG: response regulator [bacterium]